MSLPPFPGGCGTAHVGTPKRGSTHTCNAHHTASTVINVNALSMSALVSVPIEELPDALTRTLPNRIGRRDGAELGSGQWSRGVH